MIWFGGILWHINHRTLLTAKSSLYYILDIYNLVWLDFMVYHSFNAKST